MTALSFTIFSFRLPFATSPEVAKAVAPDMEGTDMPQNKITFKATADEYLTWSSIRHSQSWHQSVRRSLQRDILPLWAETPIANIRRTDGRQLVTSIAARAPRQATIANTVIRTIFEIALDEGHLDANPMLGFSKFIPKPISMSRRRILSLMEIKTLWTAISMGPGDEACKRALGLALVTGQRLSAIVAMRRCEIKGECWTIPPQKNLSRSRPHQVYLSPLALELIGVGDGYIFPSRDRSQPIKVDAVARLIRAKGPKGTPYCGLAPWVTYDLRKTVAHQMVMLGVSPEVVHAVLGHVQRNSLCVLYPAYNAEVKAALLKWEAGLRCLVKTKPPEVPSSAPCVTPPTFGL